jgi:uncharacterized protein with NRDE domain
VCTLIALHQVHRDYPLVVAANRDELHARRASGPMLLSTAPRIVGGRDEEKGGTWLGASAHGFFVGLTNQRTPGLPEMSLRSRGEVVLAALAQPGLDAAIAWLGELDAAAYNSFNLLVGDGRALWVAYARRESPRLELAPLPPGIWALPNDRLGSLEFPKIDRAVELARPLAALPWAELVPRAQAMLSDHALPEPDRIPDGPAWLPPAIRPRLQALCVHAPGYGTVSASLLAFSPRGLEHYLHAAGPPCRAPLVEQPALVAALADSTPRRPQG